MVAISTTTSRKSPLADDLLNSTRPLAFAGGDENLRRYVGNSPTNATDPTGLKKLSELEHKALQEDIDDLGKLVGKGIISKGAAFAYLFGRLFEIMKQGNNDNDTGACLQAPWIGDFILTAMFYFTDPDSTYKLLEIDVSKHQPKGYKPPRWLTSHDNTGKKEGYVQDKGDSDTTGRHDHFIANMYFSLKYGGELGALALEWYQGEKSSTDKKVNKYGRFFTFDCQREYSALEVTKLIHKHLIDESTVTVKVKGPLDRDTVFRLKREYLGKRP